MPTSTVTSRGQTTLPKQIRDYLGLQTGDRVEYSIDQDGRVVLTPSTMDLAELDGLLAARPKKPVSIRDMQRALEREVSRSVREG